MKKKITFGFGLLAIFVILTINFTISKSNKSSSIKLIVKNNAQTAKADELKKGRNVACDASNFVCILCDGSWWYGYKGLGEYCDL